MSLDKMSDLQIVTTPTRDWLAKHAKACTARMLVGSPYVNNAIIELTDMAGEEVARTLVTRTDLRDFAVGSSNLDTLCTLANKGVLVRSLDDLHAKMYIFDDSVALVTSANATRSGMRDNLECGLGTEDKQIVKQLARSLLCGLGADEPPQSMASAELEALYGPLEAIKVSFPEPPPKKGRKTLEHSAGPEFSIPDRERLLKKFSGWKRLTLEGVFEMPEEGFRLSDLVAVCGHRAAQQYPNNRHVPDKLRQQLQLLKAIGLVEFVKPGHYRRTMN